MAELFEDQKAVCVVAVEDVPRESVSSYGIVRPAAQLQNGGFVIEDTCREAAPEKAPSTLAIAARYVFSPAFYEALERTPPDKGGEIQPTDAMRLLLESGKRVLGMRLGLSEKRYDSGNFESYFEAFVEFALADPQLGPPPQGASLARIERVLDSLCPPESRVWRRQDLRGGACD